MEANIQHIWHIMFYYFKKGKNTNETQKKICAVYEEGAVTDRTCKSGLRSFVLEISRWMMPQGWVDKLKLIAVKSRH